MSRRPLDARRAWRRRAGPMLAVMAGLLAACAVRVPLDGSDATQPRALPQGFLCCNMRTDGAWISDMNRTGPNQSIVPLGTPVASTGYGRQTVYVKIAGMDQSIGNDYSRNLDLVSFARRYIVEEDPRLKLAGAAPEVQRAITEAKLRRGMSREQVLMSIGYPIASENPTLATPVWRYWLTDKDEFQVYFDNEGRVTEVVAPPAVRQQVLVE